MRNFHDKASTFFLFFISALLLFCFFACNSQKIKLSNNPCKEYFSFFKSVWRFNDTTSIYYFDGNPEWMYSEKYIAESCLIGMTENKIIKVFGDPSSYCNYISFRQMFYCLDQACLDRIMLPQGRWIRLLFDSTGVVSAVHTSPPLMQRNFRD